METIAQGEVAYIKAFNLQAKYIIHTVGPIWIDGNSNEDRILRQCYKNSLILGKKLKCKFIAFPLISSGTYKFPKDKALEIAVEEISKFLIKEDMLIYLVVFDLESFQLLERLFHDIEEYVDSYYVEKIICRECKEECLLQEMEEVDSNENAYFSIASSREVSRKGLLKDSEDLESIIATVGETFQEKLFYLIDKKKMSDVQVYKKANLDRKLFSKIRWNVNYRLKGKTAVALALALELNLQETKDLLSRAEIALSPSNKFDLIIEYFIENKVYDIYTINMTLFKYNEETIGV